MQIKSKEEELQKLREENKRVVDYINRMSLIRNEYHTS